MKKYKLFINGRNFLMEVDGQLERLGFYTTRYVEAENETEAEEAVVKLLRQDKMLVEATLNKRDDPPMIYVEEICELESFEGCKVPGGGFAFYNNKGKTV